MTKVNYEEARKFLEKINPRDRVAIYTHIDLDGLASGILFEDFCKKKKCKDVEVFFLDHYGGKKIPEYHPDRFNKFLIADLTPSIVSADLTLLRHGETLYTDHHEENPKFPIGGENVLELRTTSEGYIPSCRTVYELTEKENKKKLWLATIGVLSDRGDKYNSTNVEFLERAYKNIPSNHQEMADFMRKLENVIVFFTPDLKLAHRNMSNVGSLDEMCKLAPFYEPVEQEMKRLIKDYTNHREKTGEKIVYHLESIFPQIKSPMINRIAATNGLNVVIFYSEKEKGEISISARNHGEVYDVSEVLKDCINGLGITGGHHFAAAGSIRQEDLEKFKKRFMQYNLENARINHGK